MQMRHLSCEQIYEISLMLEEGKNRKDVVK